MSPERRYQIFLKSGGGPIDVYLVSRHDEEIAPAAPSASADQNAPSATPSNAAAYGSTALGSTPSLSAVSQRHSRDSDHTGVADMDMTGADNSNNGSAARDRDRNSSSASQNGNGSSLSLLASPPTGSAYGTSSMILPDNMPALSSQPSPHPGNFTPTRPDSGSPAPPVSVTKVTLPEDSAYDFQLAMDEGMTDLFSS